MSVVAGSLKKKSSVELAGKPEIPALLYEVEAVERRTALGKGGSAILVGGHLLGAVAAHDIFFFSSRRRHTRLTCDWSSDVCSSDLATGARRTYVRPQFVDERLI